MNQIKVESKTLMLNLSSEVQIGPLKVKLIAQVIVDEGKIDCIEFMDFENPTYMGMEISDWRKFRDMNKEFGIDYDKITKAEFNKIFTEEVVKEIIEGLK
jgi:hypothetical protein